MTRRWLSIGWVSVALAAAGPLTALAQGQPAAASREKESNVTVYGGYRFGGGLTDQNTGKTWELSEGPSWAVAADFGIDSRTQWEILVSYRNSSLRASGFSPAADNIRMGVTYYHVGGTYFVDSIGKGVYVMGGLGLTNMRPGESDLSTETRFSLNLGVGYMIPLGKTLAIKLEGRGYATLINSSGGFFCSGGCVVQIKGSTLTQAEALAGLAFRF
jgi:hypothetical protein